MIVLVTGVPGSGKSYYCVDLINNLLKEKDVEIFSNISGFRFERWKQYFYYHNKKLLNNPFVKLEHGNYNDLSEVLKKKGSDFFSYTNITKFLEPYLQQRKKVYFFLDECQQFFYPTFKDPDVIYFFDYHRHLGLDIYLITQSKHKITPQISTLVEYEIRALPRSLRFKNTYVYKKVINDDILTREIRRAKTEIFNLYSSFQLQNENFKTPFVIFLIPLFLIVAIFAALSFYTNLKKNISFGGNSGGGHPVLAVESKHEQPKEYKTFIDEKLDELTSK